MAAVAVSLLLWKWSRPIDPRFVGRWTWSDRDGSSYPVVEFRDDGIANHIAWGQGMFRTFLSGVQWWREGDQIVLQYLDPPITDFDSLTRWLRSRFQSGIPQYRFRILRVTPDEIRWQSVYAGELQTTLHRVDDEVRGP